MADIVSKSKRSQMMSGIQGKNTKPELTIRKYLFSKGYRYRIHVKNLPGKPDIVLPKYKAIIFVSGCFWHMHNCHLFKWPSTRPKFWQEKLTKNAMRDKDSINKLQSSGWRVLVIWECSLKGNFKMSKDKLHRDILKFIESSQKFLEITSIKSSLKC